MMIFSVTVLQLLLKLSIGFVLIIVAVPYQGLSNSKENARLALEYMEKVRTSECTGGTGEVLPIEFDHTQWYTQAQVATVSANLFTSLWMMHNGTPSYIDDDIMFGMTRANIVADPLIFASGFAFDEYTYKDYRMVAFYAAKKGGEISNFDISINYKYLDLPEVVWWWEPKTKTYPERNWTVNLERRFNVTGNHFAPVERFTQPYAKVEDGYWTQPYYDCGGGDIWMVTYLAPIFVSDPKEERGYKLGGVAGCDIDLTHIDINQCDEDDVQTSTSYVFRGTHLCQETTKCVPVRNLGLMSGTYYCYCADGYYFPNISASVPAFSGFDIEKEYHLSNNEIEASVFKCLPCPEDCDVCINDKPCLAEHNMVLHFTLTAVIIGDIIVIIVFMAFVVKYVSHPIIKAASPLFCYVIIFGTFIMCIEGIILSFRPTDVLCIIPTWFQNIGYFLTYGALLLRTWRIARIFQVKSAKQLRLGDKELAKRLVPIMLTVVAFQLAWTFSDPPRAYTLLTPEQLKFYYCTSNWWGYCAKIGQAIFLVWGVYLCFSVRKAPSNFNESKFISWAIYNTITVSNFLEIIRLVMLGSVGPDLIHVLHVVQLQVPTVITLLLIFMPKFYMIHMGTGENYSVTTGGPATGTAISSLGKGVTGVGCGSRIYPAPNHLSLCSNEQKNKLNFRKD